LDYQGECKKGLAHGQGEAFGRDHYTGEFKKGWPDGMGHYEWNNGDSYKGEWKKGERHGLGKFTFTISAKEIVLDGKWVNDEFVERRKEYKVEERSNVTFNIRRIGEGDKVSFWLPAIKDPKKGIQNLVLNSSSGKEVRKGSIVGFENLSFPATLSISFFLENKYQPHKSVAYLRITFIEPGEYVIKIFDNSWVYW
ncbi:MAG: hypothetical protein QNK30_11695, partial [Bacteroidales bacterium]|nr:hypothetical protein [Bacteroidales bacterium]